MVFFFTGKCNFSNDMYENPPSFNICRISLARWKLISSRSCCSTVCFRSNDEPDNAIFNYYSAKRSQHTCMYSIRHLGPIGDIDKNAFISLSCLLHSLMQHVNCWYFGVLNEQFIDFSRCRSLELKKTRLKKLFFQNKPCWERSHYSAIELNLW